MSPHRCRRLTYVDRREREATVVLTCSGDDVAIWTITSWDQRDLAIVNALARLQLLAHRIGCTIEVRDPSPELTGLLDLAGLAEVLGTPSVLRVEMVGETEGGEEAGVEEVVMPDDPVS
jgi:hypothetical protein